MLKAHRPLSRSSPAHGLASFLQPAPADERVLTPRQRQEVLALATEVTFAPRAIVYREHSPEAFIFICVDGVLKSYRELRSGRRRVMTFRFPGDLFGLAENGRYVNSVQACTPAVAYRIPVEQLKAKLRQDAELQFRVLNKMTHELRGAQRQAIMLGRRSARGRLAMFLKMLQTHLGLEDSKRIPLAMSRSDIADFLALSLEAVSRGSRQLVKSGIIAFQGPHLVRVLVQSKLDELAGDI